MKQELHAAGAMPPSEARRWKPTTSVVGGCHVQERETVRLEIRTRPIQPAM